jgi:hypothetical protein
MKSLPKPGSMWVGASDTFRVIDTVLVESEGKTWVHYMKISTHEEYSCYLESFLERFRETQPSR